MKVSIGPVSASSASAWLRFAREVLDELDLLAPDACFSTPAVRATFADYLDSWEAVEPHDGSFRWERDLDPEQVEYAIHAFFQLANFLAQRAEADGGRYSPEESDEFYSALVNGVVSALHEESHSSAEFADHLASFWPGMADVT